VKIKKSHLKEIIKQTIRENWKSMLKPGDLVNESKGKRCTVKEVRKWMKGLEENRYKKTYQSDCRRVSWLVNNSLSEDYDTMPVSMKKKWPQAAYKRERWLAKEFIKHLDSKQMNESKLEEKFRNLVREIIKSELNEAPFKKLGKNVILPNDMKTKKVVSKIIKQLRLKIDKDYNVRALKARGGNQDITILPKHYNKFLELLVKNNINPRG